MWGSWGVHVDTQVTQDHGRDWVTEEDYEPVTKSSKVVG